jgi:hypothetical protein
MVSYHHAKQWFWGTIVSFMIGTILSFIGKRILMFWDTYVSLLREKREFESVHQQCLSGFIKSQQICANVTKIIEKNCFVNAFQTVADITYSCGDHSCMDILLQILNSWSVTLVFGTLIVYFTF